jgi:hypothetical protein
VTERVGALSKWPAEASEQLVCVRWDDSWGAESGKWEPRVDDVQLDMPAITTVGFLVGIDEKWLAVAQSLADGQIGHVLRIPRGCVADVTVLNVAVERPKA